MKNSGYLSGLTRFWWIPLLTGLVFIGFGIWCLCDPAPSLTLMAYIFAGAIGAVGIFNLIYGLCNINNYYGWGWAVGGGIIEILFSIFLFFIPSPVLTWVFVYGVGLYIIFMTVFSFFDGLMTYSNSGWALLIGIFLLAALVFAIIFVLGPIGTGMIGWIWIGVSFLCYGVFRILLASRVRSLNKRLNASNE